MNKTLKNILIFLIFATLGILFYGIYQIYEIYYPNYFSQTNYTDISFLNSKIPSKSEILFYGFSNLNIIFLSSLISILLTFALNLLKRKS